MGLCLHLTHETVSCHKKGKLISRRTTVNNEVRWSNKEEHDMLTRITTLTTYIHTITGTVARLPLAKGNEMVSDVQPLFFLLSCATIILQQLTHSVYPLLLIGRRSNPSTTNIRLNTGPSYQRLHPACCSLSCHNVKGKEQNSSACRCDVVVRGSSRRGNPGIRCDGSEGGVGGQKKLIM
jgi:hypothetical protein